MNNKRNWFLLLFLSFISMALTAGGNSELEADDEGLGVQVQVTGLVRLVGNAPFSELVISGAEAEWYIVTREDGEQFIPLQHQTVTVEGEEIVRELRFAGGQSAGTRRELRKVKIIAIQ